MLEVADMHRADHLKSRALDHINWNADKVKDTLGWKLMLVPEVRVEDKEIGTGSTQPMSPDKQDHE